ncbi:MAG: hypothetical protein ACREQY_00600, partial [Candidatus Binatia bacterium]
PPPTDWWFLANTVEHVPLAVAPDGRSVAFVAHGFGRAPMLWLRRFDNVEARPIAGTEGATSLTFAPDGTALSFVAGGKLKRIGLAGGSSVTICDVAPGIGHALSWGTTGDLLFASVDGLAIFRVSAAGGVPRKVVEAGAARGVQRIAWPIFLPDGRGFLYLERASDGRDALKLVEGEASARNVAPLASRVELAGDDWLLFARDGALLAQRFDRSGARLSGSAVSVAPRIRYFYSTGWAGFAASTSGTIVALTGQNARRLTWFDRAGKRLGTVGETADYLTLALAPDGRSVVVDRTVAELGTYDLWRIDLERGVETRLTTDADTQVQAVWHPDGKRLVYSTKRERAPILVRRGLASGAEELLLPSESFQLATDISPDGRLLAYKERGDSGQFQARLLDLAGDDRRPCELVPESIGATDARFSPDGRAIAYLADTTGRTELYLAPLERPTDAVRVSGAGARLFRWSRSGGELVFLSHDDEMIAVPAKTAPLLELGAPAVLWKHAVPGSWAAFDLAPDGERFLAIVVEQGASIVPASVILGWRPESPR